MRNNLITGVDGGSFQGLVKIKEILLSGNRLVRFNSDVFQVSLNLSNENIIQDFNFYDQKGAVTLQKLDLSENFITAFPSVALKSVEHVKVLNISANMIQQIASSNFDDVKGLQILDLSRNNIGSVPPATFRQLKSLKYLDLSLNSLRTVFGEIYFLVQIL